ncbi:Arc family DNA-binding protein [Celeribacter marinus]
MPLTGCVSTWRRLMNSRKPMQLRLPQELKEWIKAESDRNGNSQNSEVIRAIRAAKDRRSTVGSVGNIKMDQGDNARC